MESSSIEVLLGCTNTNAIEYENYDVLFKIDLWEVVLQKLDKILVPSNPPDDNKNEMGNINIEETKENCLNGEKVSSGTKCCLIKIENRAALARVALLQSANRWVDGSGASVHCTNDRHRGSNIHEGNGAGTMGAHGKAMIARSIMDIAVTWCNKFGKEQLRAMLKDVQYNPKSNFNLFSTGKAIKKS